MKLLPEPAGPIRTLLHSAGVPLALKGFASLRSALGGVLPPLIVHDDGSLTDADVAVLSESFPGTRVLRRSETDDLMAPALAKRPNCRRYRAFHAFGIKLLDVLHLAEGPVRYLDGDILFLKRIEGLYPQDPMRACTLHEPTQNCQSANLRNLVWKHGCSQVQQLNAGAYYLPSGAADLDFFEWFLSKPELNGIPVYAEQTIVSVLAARFNPLRWSPPQFLCQFGEIADRPGVFAIHFIGEQKRRFDAFQVPHPAPNPARPPCFEPAPVLSRWTLTKERFGRMLK